jgi:hypothetical protein
MSKVSNVFFILSFVFSCVVLLAGDLFSQNVDVTIKLDVKAAKLSVSGRDKKLTKNLSFLTTSIGAADLADRVSNLELTDQNGKLVSYKRFSAGEYLADAVFSGWSYVVSTESPKNLRASAHISWITDNTGMLMLDDLLPQSPKSAGQSTVRLAIEVPTGWRIISSEKIISTGIYQVSNIQKAMFLIGTDLRETKATIGNSALNIATSGQWLFTDAESVRIVEDIFREYTGLFGFGTAGDLQILIVPFPQKNVQKGTWEAETRGRTVSIVSADMPFKTQSLQRLHEQMRHEIFHLWLPNGVNLSGNYDWFYEGFALYQALKTGVELNQIRFVDFLDTLSRAHNIDSMQTRPLLLIDSSQNRLSGDDTRIYARGMLVAFLCDLSLLQSSKGKKTIGDIYRKLYDAYKPPNPVSDANTAIKKVFASYPQLASVVADYIEGSQKIDWQARLEWAGIENEPGGSRTNLRVKTKLSGSQKALLNKLGYNKWRKLTRKSR